MGKASKEGQGQPRAVEPMMMVNKLTGLIWLRMGQRQVSSFCECGNESEGLTKCGEFVDLLGAGQLVEDYAQCSLSVS
jgi:hypothetical protein